MSDTSLSWQLVTITVARYEVAELQRRVRSNYEQLKDETWVEVSLGLLCVMLTCSTCDMSGECRLEPGGGGLLPAGPGQGGAGQGEGAAGGALAGHK